MRRNVLAGGFVALVLAMGALVGGVTSPPVGAAGSAIMFTGGGFPTLSVVGGTLTLEVELSDSSGPAAGAAVTWAVVNGPNVGLTGAATSDAAGIASFSYTGTAVGTDQVRAYFVDSDGDVAITDALDEYWVSAAPAAVGIQQGADTNPVGVPHTVVVTVTDADDQPIADVPLELISTPLFQRTPGHTDSRGTATFTYTQTEPGDEFLRANVRGTSLFSAELTKTWTPIGALSLAPVASVNAIGSDHTVLATAIDKTGAPIEGTEVTFEIEGAHNFSAAALTDASGVAQLTYTGDNLGVDSIEASVTDPDGNLVTVMPARKVWAPLTGAYLVLSPSAAENPTSTPHWVTATAVRDAAPVEGVAVDFEVTVGPDQGQTGSDTTGADGIARFSIYSPDPGEDTIVASFDDNGTVVTSEEATKTWIRTAALVLTPDAAVNTVGTPHTVTATLTDDAGAPIPDAGVQFLVDGANTTTPLGPAAVMTDAAGTAEFTYLGLFEGTDEISAQYIDMAADRNAYSNTVTKVWEAVRPALSLDLVPESATNPVGTPHTLTATLTDAGTPVPDAEITFTVTDGPNAGTTGAATTTADGTATFSYTGSAPGIDSIIATAMVEETPVMSGTATKEWVLPPGVTLTLAPESAENPVGTEHSVTATLMDGDIPLAGVEVAFEVTDGPQAGADGTATTDAIGQASFTYFGDLPGTDTIVAGATVDGEEVTSNEVTKTWVSPVPAVVRLMPETSENPVGSEHTVSAIVSDAGGLPVPGVAVTFVVFAGPHMGTTGTMTTTSTGTAWFAYTGTSVGTDTIVASIDVDGARLDSNPVAKTWVDDGIFDEVELRALWGPAANRTLAYDNGGTLSAGDYVVDPDTGEPTSIDGTGTLASSSGSGDATIAFHLTFDAGTNKWGGTVEIDDPGAGFVAEIPVFAGPQRITRDGNRVEGTLYGIKRLSTPQKCFELHFVIIDNNGAGGEPLAELADDHIRLPARWATHETRDRRPLRNAHHRNGHPWRRHF